MKVLLKESAREREKKTAGKSVLSDLIKQETLEYFMMQLFYGKNHIILALQKSSKKASKQTSKNIKHKLFLFLLTLNHNFNDY